VGATKEQKEQAKEFVDLIKKAKGSQKVYFAVGKGSSGPVVHVDKKKPNACVSTVKSKKASTIVASGQVKFDDDLALCCLKQSSENDVRKSFFQFFKDSEASIPGVSENKIRVLQPKDWDSAAEDEDAQAAAQPASPAQAPAQAAAPAASTWSAAAPTAQSGPAAAAAAPATAPSRPVLGQQRAAAPAAQAPSAAPATAPSRPVLGQQRAAAPAAQAPSAAEQGAKLVEAYKALVPQMQARAAAAPQTQEALKRVAGVFQETLKSGAIDSARAALDELTKMVQGQASQPPPRPTTPAPDTAPPQSMGAMVVLWRGDFGKLAGEEVPWLKMSALVQLAVNGDILDLLDKEDRAGAVKMFMIDDAQQLCEQYVDQFVEKLMKLDFGGERRNVTIQQIQQATQNAFDQLRPQLEQALQQIPQRRWQRFQSAKTKWRDYKIKAATNVAIGSLQIAAGAISIAAAVPTMGGTLPFAIIATARGVYKTATEVYEILKDAEHHQKELLENMTNLAKAYQQSKGRAIGQEITATLLKGLLGSDALFIDSLPKCEKTYTAWQANVALLRIRNVKFGNKAMDLMTKIGEMEQVVDESKPKNAAKMKTKIESMRGLVTQLLDKSSDLGARVGKAEQAEKTIEPAMVELRQAVPNYVKIFDTIFPAVVSIGLGAASGGLEIAHAEGVIELAKGSLEIATEVLDSAREALEG
jgi:hypothetical protein